MGRRSKHLRPRPAIVAVLALALLCGDDQPSKEYKLKAAFIYNFARFIEWPASAFGSADAPFVIAVVGADPFGGILEQAMSGKTVGTRRVEIRHFDSIDKLAPCQILFVPETDDDTEASIIQRVKNDPVLTIGESENFASDGGCLRFFQLEKKVGFEINTDAAAQTQLKISSKLLTIARIFKK